MSDTIFPLSGTITASLLSLASSPAMSMRQLFPTLVDQLRRRALDGGFEHRHELAPRKAGRNRIEELNHDCALLFQKPHRAGTIEPRVQRHGITRHVELAIESG